MFKRLALGLMCLQSYGLMANVYEFRLDSLSDPKYQSECDTYIASVGERFAAATGHDVIGTGCILEHSLPKLNGVISYVAEKRVSRLTNFVRGVLGSSSQAFYQKVAECRADKAKQTAIFEQAFGVKAFNSYCYIPLSSRAVGMRIDAFGKSKVKSHIGRTPLYYPIIDQARVIADVRKAAEAAGVVVGNVGITRGMAGKELTLQYYAEKSAARLDRQLEPIKFSKADHCLQQVKDVEAALADQAFKPATTFCTAAARSGRSRMQIVMLGRSHFGDGVFRLKDLPTSYPDHASCMASKPSVVSKSPVILGAICRVNDDGRIGMLMIQAPPEA